MPFPFIPILIALAVGVTLSVVAALLAPKPKVPKTEVQDLENPTADAGRPIPVLFGQKKVKGINILWYGEKQTDSREV